MLLLFWNGAADGPATGPGGIGSPIGLLLALTYSDSTPPTPTQTSYGRHKRRRWAGLRILDEPTEALIEIAQDMAQAVSEAVAPAYDGERITKSFLALKARVDREVARRMADEDDDDAIIVLM
jgi:hypothetical protein